MLLPGVQVPWRLQTYSPGKREVTVFVTHPKKARISAVEHPVDLISFEADSGLHEQTKGDKNE